jgi:3-phenylpropionate/cinnamic acid dioxygenase small subunit
MNSVIEARANLDVSDVTRLMATYAAALDRRELETWADFFAAEAKYSVASSENMEAGWPLLLISDGSKSRIQDRVRYVREFWNGSFNDYLTRHVLSTPVILEAGDSGAVFEQSFALYVTETDLSGERGGQSSLLCVGRYVGHAGMEGDELKLSKLEAILDTFTMTRSLVYPV